MKIFRLQNYKTSFSEVFIIYKYGHFILFTTILVKNLFVDYNSVFVFKSSCRTKYCVHSDLCRIRHQRHTLRRINYIINC